jgi:hypothetical protein
MKRVLLGVLLATPLIIEQTGSEPKALVASEPSVAERVTQCSPARCPTGQSMFTAGVLASLRLDKKDITLQQFHSASDAYELRRRNIV